MQLTATWASRFCFVVAPTFCPPIPALFQSISRRFSWAAKAAAAGLTVVRSERSRERGLRVAGVEGGGWAAETMSEMALLMRSRERPAR